MALLGRPRWSALGTYGGPAPALGITQAPFMIPLPFTLPIAGPKIIPDTNEPQSCQEANDALQLLVTVVDETATPVNLMGATAISIALLLPDGTIKSLVASLYTNGMDGVVAYTTTAADIVQDGLYRVQAKFTLGGKTMTTRWGRLWVGENIEED